MFGFITKLVAKLLERVSLKRPAFREPHFVTDQEGHYDIDGVSYGCDEVIVSSNGNKQPCLPKTSERFTRKRKSCA